MRILSLLILCPALLSACLPSFQRPAPRTAWLGIDASLPSGGLSPGGPTVEVLPFSTATAFRTDRVATRSAENDWAFSHYHRWVAEPGDMVSAAAARYLARADLFGAVMSAMPPFQPDYRLGGSVRELYWDRGRNLAVLELELSMAAFPSGFCGFWIRRAEVPVPGDSVAGFTRAAALALEEVFSALRSDLEACTVQRASTR
jgi:ABC-type uncharacterized transport system auxiliary subunit